MSENFESLFVEKCHAGDALKILRENFPDQCVDLVVGSPPYEDARDYGIGFKLKGEEWVRWMVELWHEFQRVSRGLVCMVVEGRTQKFRYSATPLLLGADLHRAGFHLRKPLAYERVGVFGGGGPDFLRNDWEPIICTARPGKLPWSDNTACGHPPKYKPGGDPSHRNRKGERSQRKYVPPALANPGNVLHCVVGGGRMGSLLAHRNEAPFPEMIPNFLIRSFCPPGGIVLDPFCGSGTTPAAAIKSGRRWIGIDVRAEQVSLTGERVAEAARLVEEERERREQREREA